MDESVLHGNYEHSLTSNETGRVGACDTHTHSCHGSCEASGRASPAYRRRLPPATKHEHTALGGLSAFLGPCGDEAGPHMSFHDESERILGCSHYQRRNWISPDCCGKLYPCRRCHDIAENHVMDRRKTKLIKCMLCGAWQKPSQTCEQCLVQFARYYCDVCKLWDDDPNRDIYHCDKCGICRVGKGLGKDFFHCDKCNACVSLESKADHFCLAGSLDGNCPVCNEHLYTSLEKVIYMRCGHTMHYNCFQEYTKHYFTCPLCRKALGDMTEFYRCIEQKLRYLRGSQADDRQVSVITCNDCERRSEVPHHSVYHMCTHCNGFNTFVMNVVRV